MFCISKQEQVSLKISFSMSVLIHLSANNVSYNHMSYILIGLVGKYISSIEFMCLNTFFDYCRN